MFDSMSYVGIINMIALFILRAVSSVRYRAICRLFYIMRREKIQLWRRLKGSQLIGILKATFSGLKCLSSPRISAIISKKQVRNDTID